ncbi:MAG: site-specific integrase [Candidatus Nanoarchaeia archaeon]|nr:site-specific integrase [Candidatus Nanoarchaeia archaeon]
MNGAIKNLQERYSERTNTCTKKRLPCVPTKEEVMNLLAYVDDVRLGFFIFSSIFQGLRIGEFVKLKWADVDLIHGELKVVDGKNTRRYKSGYGKDRLIPINIMFLPIWKSWRLMNPEQEYVLPADDRFGVRAEVKSLIRQVQDKLTTALKKANLQEVDYLQVNGNARHKYHAHSFRHVCGTNLRRSGMKIEDVRDFLGHEDIDTTQIYTEMTREDLRESSYVAYAYPKSNLGANIPSVEISLDKESLMLQKEILDKQLELAKLKMTNLRGVEVYEYL